MAAQEEVDLVDDKDSVIGVASLRDCLERGLLHRAVAVIVEQADGSVLLQRRSTRDLWNPGLWTLSCTGHVKKGENYRQAASRELLEELGLRSPLRSIWKLKLPQIRDRSLIEHEWVSVFRTRTEVEPTLDPAELSAVKEVNRAELLKIAKGRSLAEDARILIRRYLETNPN